MGLSPIKPIQVILEISLRMYSSIQSVLLEKKKQSGSARKAQFSISMQTRKPMKSASGLSVDANQSLSYLNTRMPDLTCTYQL